MKQPYCVEITRTSTFKYHVPNCNSPEEAESVAMEWMENGDEGEPTGELEIIETDAYPCAESEAD